MNVERFNADNTVSLVLHGRLVRGEPVEKFKAAVTEVLENKVAGRHVIVDSRMLR